MNKLTGYCTRCKEDTAHTTSKHAKCIECGTINGYRMKNGIYSDNMG